LAIVVEALNLSYSSRQQKGKHDRSEPVHLRTTYSQAIDHGPVREHSDV